MCRPGFYRVVNRPRGDSGTSGWVRSSFHIQGKRRDCRQQRAAVHGLMTASKEPMVPPGQDAGACRPQQDGLARPDTTNLTENLSHWRKIKGSPLRPILTRPNCSIQPCMIARQRLHTTLPCRKQSSCPSTLHTFQVFQTSYPQRLLSAQASHSSTDCAVSW